MNSEFRGFSQELNKFIFGSLIKLTNGGGAIINKNAILKKGIGDSESEIIINAIKVDFESIGQFTTATDKKGIKIFLGDIVIDEESTNDSLKMIVDFQDCTFCLVWKDDIQDLFVPFHEIDFNRVEVIGNAYLNPELLIEK